MKPVLILINPWIYDFAAYDLWSKPLGLFYLAGHLREWGYHIHLIDCLDVHHQEMEKLMYLKPPRRRLYGTGKFWKEEVAKPTPLRQIPRSYQRYGITKKIFKQELEKIKNPSAILVTSLMTYWYPGVREAISLAKEVHPDTPVILGGTYVRLCPEHAHRFSGADYVSSEVPLDNPESLLRILHRFRIPVPNNSPEKQPFPAFDMLRKIDYICLVTSFGCPYHCQYCASSFLNPLFTRRDPGYILEEIEFWYNTYSIMDFAFYDDALLIDFENHLGLVLEGLLRRDLHLRFHTPNAMHVREISQDIAGLLFRSGFQTLRLGLETSDDRIHQDLDRKVFKGEFEKAVTYLKKAGFSRKQIGAYILMGLPGHSVGSVVDTIQFVDRIGAEPYLAEYSPLPHSRLWERAVACSEYDIINEPLFHNNSLLACWDKRKKRRVPELRRMVKEIRKAL